ncbi:hypothetical protein K435DRAFT_528197 [Dendrothele bispora CBS 962.96]|uniref:Uncharacterized protein n=1 Tax=Dendrothele bispora (strain CBS 962.96) TaxID=1314807 RepID=A0A4S8KU43_DENBC|nr:hypothetical protein K435DRAFT_528197 [Dendrothele bispora CBS 962.96]
MRRHVMSAPRTEIRSTPFDPLSKPTTHVPSFSMDSFILPFSSSSMGTTLESELEEEEEVVGTKGSTIDDEEMELGEVKEMKDLEELEEEDPERSKKEMEMESAETAVSVSVYVANTNT